MEKRGRPSSGWRLSFSSKENHAWMEKLTAANSWNANKVRELEQELLKSNRVIDSLSQELDAIKSTRVCKLCLFNSRNLLYLIFRYLRNILSSLSLIGE